MELWETGLIPKQFNTILRPCDCITSLVHCLVSIGRFLKVKRLGREAGNSPPLTVGRKKRLLRQSQDLPLTLTWLCPVLYLACLRKLPEVPVGLMIVRGSCYCSFLALLAKYAVLPTAHRTVPLHVVTAVT